jgi:hypothetical protein
MNPLGPANSFLINGFRDLGQNEDGGRPSRARPLRPTLRRPLLLFVTALPKFMYRKAGKIRGANFWPLFL